MNTQIRANAYWGDIVVQITAPDTVLLDQVQRLVDENLAEVVIAQKLANATMSLLASDGRGGLQALSNEKIWACTVDTYLRSKSSEPMVLVISRGGDMGGLLWTEKPMGAAAPLTA